MNQHKWHKEIKAWADGAEIEARYEKAEGWSDWKLEEGGFVWYQNYAEYRIKLQPKEPQYLYVYHTTKGIELGYVPHEGINMYNIKLVGKIKLEFDDDES